VSDDADSGDPDTDESGEGDSGDPFDSFDEYRDRDGDPFDSFGDDSAGSRDAVAPSDDAGTEDSAESSPSESAGAVDPDPFEYMGDRGGGRSDRTGESDRIDDADGDDGFDERGEDPLADVTVSDEDPFESSASAFERSGVEGIDPDEVWDRLTAESEAGDGRDADGVGDPAEGDGDDIVTVSKHGYCEGCEHFSAPPDVACGHEGTDILEFVDLDSVRVSDCPVVDERRELEEDA